MTSDKNATERLRELLDERGVRWTGCSKNVTDNQTYCYGHTYTEFQDGLMVTDLTPEQAIAATLDGGRLTAEQVRELIAPHLHARPTFDFGHYGAVWSADFQAIADALNATLGNDGVGRSKNGVDERGTCELEINTDVNAIRCSKCGYVVPKGTDLMGIRYCASCGRKVVLDG